ncbi:hypothetical protein [Actinomadura miaoliensis]|uniref:hypothetical protein n=1 Tax=Actinomadura miaoliensis TaxID=430685 RepID=UPI0031F00EBC
MEIDEVAARVVRGYWPLLLGMLLVPLVLVAVVVGRQEPQHTATARLQAGGRAADAAAGDAGVSMAVSQVKAFATGRALLERVLGEQRVVRDPDAVAERITVAGLGASTVVELSVRDTDPRVARRLTDALGRAVVVEINRSDQGPISTQLADIERRMRDLERRLGPLSRRAAATPPDIDAANERERVQAELSDLRTTRTELRTRLTTSGTASFVQPAVLKPPSNPAVMMSAVAGLTGLVTGVLVAVVIEMFRPTVPGQRRVARRLGAPLLGWADRGPAARADLGRRMRLSARRVRVRRVALVTTGSGPLPADLVSTVAAAVYGDRTTVAAPASSTPNGRVAGEGLCHVHAFEDVDPGAGERTGVVAVVGPLTRAAALESVRDLVAASGWPLLGVVAVSRGRSLSRRTTARNGHDTHDRDTHDRDTHDQHAQDHQPGVTHI